MEQKSDWKSSILHNKMIEFGEPRSLSPKIAKALEQADMSDTEIFFHIGIERTGTKYLQKRIFPTYKNLHFINKNNYLNAKEIILKKEHPRYLVSMELNLNDHFETEVEDFLDAFPNAKIIIVLRPIDEWLVSHYKRIVKNGFDLSFSELWNEKGGSIYNPEDIFFMKKLRFLELKVKEKPLILLYDELKKSPISYLEKIAKYVGEGLNKDNLDFRRVHSSYSTKQLKSLQLVMRHMKIARIKPYNNSLGNGLYRFKVDSIRYSVMYMSKIIPDVFFNNNPIVDYKEIQRVKQYYANDWDETMKYIKRLFKNY